MTSRGQFDRLITVQRATVATDDYGQEIPSAYPAVETGWARVRFGTAQEKREAAQERGEQSATFELIPTTALRTVTLKDQILFEGSSWDVREVAPLERNLIRFTAARSV